MASFLIPLLFLVGADQPAVDQSATEQATPPAVTQPAPEAKPEEPKMVCRNERVTGSRVAKERVCRPVGGTHADLDAATQRNMGLNPNVPSGAPMGITPREGGF